MSAPCAAVMWHNRDAAVNPPLALAARASSGVREAPCRTAAVLLAARLGPSAGRPGAQRPISMCHACSEICSNDARIPRRSRSSSRWVVVCDDGRTVRNAPRPARAIGKSS